MPSYLVARGKSVNTMIDVLVEKQTQAAGDGLLIIVMESRW